MIIRGARVSDWQKIIALYSQYDFTLDTTNIESVVVIEVDSQVVAAGAITKLVEAAFVVDKDKTSRKQRLDMLNRLLAQADVDVGNLGYKSYHVFATNEPIFRILIKKFNFVMSKGRSLIRWIGA